jgi:hypothetical protein
MIGFRFLFMMSLFFLSFKLSSLFYIKIEEEKKFNLWDFLILFFESLDRDKKNCEIEKSSNSLEQKNRLHKLNV